MKKIVNLLLFLAVFYAGTAQNKPVCDSNWSERVKTVTLNHNGIEQEGAWLVMGDDGGLLMLRFDILGEQPEALRYKIIHCDADWRPDDTEPVEYYSGFNEAAIENYQHSFTTLQPYINYYQTFPSEYERFLISGNYIVSVFLQDYPDSILLTRRFCVSENAVRVSYKSSRATTAGDLMRDQEVEVEVYEKDGITAANFITLRPEYLTVRVQQNGRRDNMKTLSFNNYDKGHLCYRWKDVNVFRGGNSYRYFDISNIRTPMYNVAKIEQYGGEHFALLRPEEDRSRKAFSSGQTLNGGMKTNVWDRTEVQTEADYVWVNFTLPMERPLLGGSIHIVGELTQWSLGEGSVMEWNSRMKAYTKRLLLKQGYYAYQLLYLPAGGHEAQTATLEGDHSETANDYHISVYYRFPGERYDRLLYLR